MNSSSRCVLAMSILTFASRAFAADGEPVALRCEYRVDPQGIDEAQPRLTWRIESQVRGRRQTAYRILVAGAPEILATERGDLWDSGKVADTRHSALSTRHCS